MAYLAHLNAYFANLASTPAMKEKLRELEGNGVNVLAMAMHGATVAEAALSGRLRLQALQLHQQQQEEYAAKQEEYAAKVAKCDVLIPAVLFIIILLCYVRIYLARQVLIEKQNSLYESLASLPQNN